MLPACTTSNNAVILQDDGESVTEVADTGVRPLPATDRTDNVGEPGHDMCETPPPRPRSLHVLFNEVMPENTLPSPAKNHLTG